MGVTQARRIAFEVLTRVDKESAYAADLLHARLHGPMKREDAALATELTLGVLRWQRLLDFLLERHLSQPIGSLDLEVLLALRMGLYQLRYLSRVPARAAVNESVELTKQAKKGSAVGLVNAVLRRAAQSASQPAEQLVPQDLPAPERLSILYSHPTWMVCRWLELFGQARTLALLEANNRAHRVTCIVWDDAQLEHAAEALRKAGLSVEPGKLLRAAWTVHGGDPAKTNAFRRGWILFQSEASYMVALLVDVKPGQRILDVCAAPGGKTSVLARAAGPEALVVGADNHLHRLRAMRQHLKRVGAGNIHLLTLNATSPLPLAADFDRILVDAPCSGTGTLAANPEIRWRLRPEDLADFQHRQMALLSHALDRLAPGGWLAYSTCSLEPEENEQVVSGVLAKRRDIRCMGAADALRPHLKEGVGAESLFGTDNYFRTFPPDQDTDGFFAAVLKRTLNH